MNYTYLASQYCTPNISALDIYSDLPGGQLKYICYHITTNSYRPFIQIMLAKTVSCFTCPSITINNDSTSSDISFLILRKIKADLKRLKCNTDILTKDAYKGIFSTCAKSYAFAIKSKSKDPDTMYALIDVSSVDISSLHLSRSEPIWFALPTEIVNINSICDIPIAEDVINLFTYLLPELGVLYKKNSRDNYLLPDIVYTRSKLKQAEFRTLFGPSRNKGYFHFCKSYLDATKDATKEEENAINRYALFIDNPIIVEMPNAKKCEDLEELLNEKYCSSTHIFIIQNWHILVKKYELFQPLSYHILPLM